VIAPLWVAPVDLDNCATEPIHVPGAIQPHGVLVAMTEPDLVIAVVSANLPHWFGTAVDEAIGHDLADVIGSQGRDIVDRVRTMDWMQRFDEIPIAHLGRSFDGTLYRSGPYLVLEIEAAATDGNHGAMVLREAAMALQTTRTALDVAQAAARWIRSLSEFDRVMVYRFDADWNGEVIAENRREDLNPFLGLRYPASDIPAQARELYRRNWLRLIPDIGYEPVPLVPAVAFDTARPLDLSTSTVRSVSPIHIEYLGNMGVGASMSVSIVINGELWGLIACHHYSGAHHVSVSDRNAAEFLAQLISLRISETIESDERSRTIEHIAIANSVAHEFASITRSSIDRVLREHETDVLAVADASGMVVRAEGTVTRLGITPSDDVVRDIIDAWPADVEVLQTDRLGEMCTSAVANAQSTSGALAFALLNDRSEYIMWFRPELVQSVDWGGDPHNAKLALVEDHGVRLSPRRSFDLWREIISGRAKAWDNSAVQAAQHFTRHLGAARLRNERDSASLARDLQRIMMPSALPSVPGYEFSVFSQAAGRGEIGGDWYDAFPVDDSNVAVIIGDVAGHGLAAASEMTQLRNILRAYLTERPDPAEALERLDRYILRTLPGSIATVVCAVIDTTTSTMRISHAGHVPALIVGPDATAFMPLDGDTLLGLMPSTRSARTYQLSDGDTVVLYSDGLVETRRLTVDQGLTALQREAPRAIRDGPGTDRAAGLAARLVTAEHHDDISLLFVHRTSSPSSHRTDWAGSSHP
jgi:chemotaxis family two-component system sensor kinase Cph1